MARGLAQELLGAFLTSSTNPPLPHLTPFPKSLGGNMTTEQIMYFDGMASPIHISQVRQLDEVTSYEFTLKALAGRQHDGWPFMLHLWIVLFIAVS
jgi:hypothetical protein